MSKKDYFGIGRALLISIVITATPAVIFRLIMMGSVSAQGVL